MAVGVRHWAGLAEIGAAWKKTTQDAADVSLRLERADPGLAQPIDGSRVNGRQGAPSPGPS